MMRLFSLLDVSSVPAYGWVRLLLFCVVMVWARVGQKQFRSEGDQAEFLDALEEPMNRGDFETAAALCEGDGRAMPQLARMAIENREIGYAKGVPMGGDLSAAPQGKAPTFLVAALKDAEGSKSNYWYN